MISKDFLRNQSYFAFKKPYYDHNEYYQAGILFLIAVLLLLIYANFYYENCVSNLVIDLSHSRYCCFIRYFFDVQIKQLDIATIVDDRSNLKRKYLLSDVVITVAHFDDESRETNNNQKNSKSPSSSNSLNIISI